VFHVRRYPLPSPYDVIATLYQAWPNLLVQAWPTTLATLAAFALSAC
jgi:NitT/TauT family transport system permease protein